MISLDLLGSWRAADLPAGDGPRGAGQGFGDIGADSGRHQQLFGGRDRGREPFSADGVELGEDVVQDQDRFNPIGTQQVEGADRQGQRVRPG